MTAHTACDQNSAHAVLNIDGQLAGNREKITAMMAAVMATEIKIFFHSSVVMIVLWTDADALATG